LDAQTQAQVIAISMGGGGTITKSDGDVASLAGAAAGSGNTIVSSIVADIANGSTVTSTRGSVRLTATDSTLLTAVSGIGAFVVDTQGKVAGSAGVSGAVNLVYDATRTWIDSSRVTGQAGLELTAETRETIQALTLAGTLDVATGDNNA